MKVHGRAKKKVKNKKQELINPSLAISPVSADLRSHAMQLDISGKSVEAQRIYRQICDIKSNAYEDLINIADAQKCLDNKSNAAAVFEKTMALYPENQEVYQAYAAFLSETDSPEEALAIYEKAILRFKNNCRLYFEKALIYYRQNKFEKTRLALYMALASNDVCFDYAIRIGNSFFEFRDFEKAQEAYEKAIELDKYSAIAYANKGAALLELEKFEEALLSMDKAVALDKNSSQNFYNRALILSKIGSLGAAILDFNVAITLNPSNKYAHYSLSSALFKNGDVKSAISAVDEAIKIDRNYGDAYSNKGVFLVDIFCFAEARDILTVGVEADPACVEVKNSLAHVLMLCGELSASEQVYRQALRLDNKNKIVISNLLFLLNYMKSTSGVTLKKEAIQLSDRIASSINSFGPGEALRGKKSKLRIGFVSGDLNSHPVGCFLQSVIEKLDTQKIAFFGLYNSAKTDQITEKLQAHADGWENIYFKSDEDVAILVRKTNIDILFDLSGHTDKNRLSVFAYKPAPIQISWLGYCGTTGLSQVDYILGDPYVTPENEEHHFVEKIWRLPETYWCFTPPQYNLDVEDLPAKDNGHITFACFNNITKVNEDVIRLWAKVVKACPDSRLFLKTRQFSDPRIEKKFREKFAQFGINDNQLIIEGQSSRQEYLKTYNRVDIALDPFPFPGGTTSIEGLWMGVPFITKKGDRFYSHNGETILHNIGLPEWIAVDEDDYVRKLIEVSQDIDALSKLRKGLRAQILRSPLFDADRFARNFEKAMFEMWERYCSEEVEKHY